MLKEMHVLYKVHQIEMSNNVMKQNGNKVLSKVAKFISAATKLRSEMLV